jgi:hypothetical protein
MSFKRITKKVIENYSVTGLAPFYSKTLEISDIEGYSHQINHENGLNFNCDITVQGSNDSVKWSDITTESVAVTGVSGTSIIDVFDHNYGFSRLKIDGMSGTGNLEIITLLRSRQE